MAEFSNGEMVHMKAFVVEYDSGNSWSLMVV